MPTPAGSNYTVTVTADGYDTKHQTGISVTSEGTTTVNFALSCADTDNDGLCDDVETNTGIYVSPNDTGTDPNNNDTDGDKMPDGWEVNNGLDPLFDDADGDEDGDGANNLMEYIRGTDPNDENSKPVMAFPWLPLLLEN